MFTGKVNRSQLWRYGRKLVFSLGENVHSGSLVCVCVCVCVYLLTHAHAKFMSRAWNENGKHKEKVQHSRRVSLRIRWKHSKSVALSWLWFLGKGRSLEMNFFWGWTQSLFSNLNPSTSTCHLKLHSCPISYQRDKHFSHLHGSKSLASPAHSSLHSISSPSKCFLSLLFSSQYLGIYFSGLPNSRSLPSYRKYKTHMQIMKYYPLIQDRNECYSNNGPTC